MKWTSDKTPLALYFEKHPKDSQAELTRRYQAEAGTSNSHGIISRWRNAHGFPRPLQQRVLARVTYGACTEEQWKAYGARIGRQQKAV